MPVRVAKKEKFTALLRHINSDMLMLAFYALKRNAAPGADGVEGLRAMPRGKTRGPARPRPSRRLSAPSAPCVESPLWT